MQQHRQEQDQHRLGLSADAANRIKVAILPRRFAQDGAHRVSKSSSKRSTPKSSPSRTVQGGATLHAQQRRDIATARSALEQPTQDFLTATNRPWSWHQPDHQLFQAMSTHTQPASYSQPDLSLQAPHYNDTASSWSGQADFYSSPFEPLTHDFYPTDGQAYVTQQDSSTFYHQQPLFSQQAYPFSLSQQLSTDSNAYNPTSSITEDSDSDDSSDDESGELVGMGLYDGPVSLPQQTPLLFSGIFEASTISGSTGKGLILEESFVPPVQDSADSPATSVDDDDDDEDEHEDEKPPSIIEEPALDLSAFDNDTFDGWSLPLDSTFSFPQELLHDQYQPQYWASFQYNYPFTS